MELTILGSIRRLYPSAYPKRRSTCGVRIPIFARFEALNSISHPTRQECGRWLNNRAENSHLPFRRREGAIARFRDIKTLQKFAAVHGSIYNHFNHQRNLNHHQVDKQHPAAALAEWRELAA